MVIHWIGKEAATLAKHIFSRLTTAESRAKTWELNYFRPQVSSVEHSKAAALLLLIHCVLLPPLFCVVMFGPCFVVHYLVSSFAIISL